MKSIDVRMFVLFFVGFLVLHFLFLKIVYGK